MSFKLLKMNSDNKIKQGMNYLNEDIYLASGRTYFRYIRTTIGSGSMQNPLGMNVSVKLDHATDYEAKRLKACILKMSINNTSTTNAPTFKNMFNIFEKIKFTADHNLKVELTRQQLILLYAEHLSNYANPEQRQLELLKIRTENGDTYAGETVPIAGSLSVELDLTPVMPTILQNQVFGGGKGAYSALEIEFFFSPDTGNPATMCGYVTSSDVNNAWTNANITLSNMVLERVCEVTTNDAYVAYPKLFDWTTYYKVYEVTLTNWVLGATYSFLPNNDMFSEATNLLDYQFMLYDPVQYTAYNNANAQMYYSGPSYLGVKATKNDVDLYDHTGASNLRERQKYMIEYYKRRYNVDVPTQFLDDGTDTGLTKYYMWPSVIDMSNVETDKNDNYVITTESSKSADYKFVISCEKQLPTTSTVKLLIGFHYYRSLQSFR